MDECWATKLCRALESLRANRLAEHPLVGGTRHRWSRLFDLLCIDWTRDNWPCSAGSETSIAWRRQPFGKCVRNLYYPLSICYLDTVRIAFCSDSRSRKVCTGVFNCSGSKLAAHS